METTKLTLSIPKKVLVTAKQYSRETGQPLSRLVSRYFEVLSQGALRDAPISKNVLKVTGLAKSSRNDNELLREALKDKYHL